MEIITDVMGKVLVEFKEKRKAQIQTATAAEPDAVWHSTAGDDALAYCKTAKYQYSIPQRLYSKEMEGQRIIDLAPYIYSASALSDN